MDFITAVNTILTTVKRPDKEAVCKSGINRTISLYTKTIKWYADHVEKSVTINPAEYAQIINIKAEFPNFRAISYLRPEWLSPNDKAGYLHYLAPDKIFTPSGTEQTNTWYRSGANIVFKLATPANKLEAGYWRSWPYLIADDDSHWMLDDMFEVIHDKVAAMIFTDIGNDTEARKYEGYAAVGLDGAKADLATGVDTMTQSA